MAAATRTAVEVRRLQEQTALHVLRVRQRETAETRREADRLADGHETVLQAWAGAAARPRVDVTALGLWRAEARAAELRRDAAREALKAAEASLEQGRTEWAAGRRRAEAADAVARRAARDLRRAEEERGLRETEDRHPRVRGRGE
jgi:hypothetical protein